MHRMTILILAVTLSAPAGVATTPAAQAKPAATAKAKPKLTPYQKMQQAGFQAMGKLWAIKDPEQRVTAWVHFAKTHPAFLTDRSDGATNAAYALHGYIKANRKDGAKLQRRLAAVDRAFPAGTVGKSLFETMTATSLLKNDAALDYAAELDQNSIRLLRQKPYIAWERRDHAARQAYAAEGKFNVPEAFSIQDAENEYREEMASRYSLLGRIEEKMGRPDAALVSYRRALGFHADMSAYRGVAKLELAQGDREAALEALYSADLTGHLDAKSIHAMRRLYAELHPGASRESLARLLDRKYEATFHNPVQWSAYAGEPGAPRRAVLAELMTGAGCIPCMAPDLALDAALDRYNRRTLVLVVYHDNAPDSDPLANDVTDARDRYYSTGGSTPHAFLDGKEIALVQGTPRHAQAAYDAMTKPIDRLLGGPARAELRIMAQRRGRSVRVRVWGTVLTPSRPLALHIDLVSREVSYSGENGLRLQRMVVRATARLAHDGGGIPVHGRRFAVSYTFRIPGIEKANLAYYKQFDAEVKKRTRGLFGATYREHKNLINPDRLAIVAFVQDNGNHAVLQSAYEPVLSTAVAGAKEAR
ncbi:MAG: tetratricopeptide repeat protein [Terriglobales bacterium]